MIVFDLDGTIADVTDIQLTIFSKLFGKTKEFYKPFFGPPKPIMIKQIYPNYNILQIQLICKKWNLMFKKSIRKQKVICRETVEIIKELKKKYKLGIITSSEKGVALSTMKEIFFLFDFVLTSKDYKEPKPNPESLFKIIKKYRIKPKNIIYVGDNKNDIIFGKNAGTKTIGKEDVLYTKKQLEKYKPNAIITKISDLKCLA